MGALEEMKSGSRIAVGSDAMVDAKLSLATRALIADHTAVHTTEVAPNISLTTTFRHPHPDSPAAADPDVHAPHRHIYSRYTTPTLSRTEQVLASVIGQPTLTYPSGISAGTSCRCSV